MTDPAPKVDPFAALAAILSKLPTTPPADTTAKPATTIYPSVYSATQAKAKINDIFQSLLKRDATNAEVKIWTPKLIAAQKASPSQQTVKIIGGKNVVSSIGGLDEAQWLTDALSTDPILKVEITKFNQADPTLLKRQAEKKLYDQAILAAAGDPNKIAQVETSTTYGQQIKSIKDAITQSAFEAGATLDPSVVDSIAKEAYDKNLDKSKDTFNSFVNNKFKFAGTAATGQAGKDVAALAKVAAANGLDLQKAFGTQLPTWLDAINKGESIDTFANTIRSVAKIGMPENIKKLIDTGVNLDSIYSPYKNIMANTLEINPESISMSDPVLRSAIGGETELPLYEFERQLRKDNRWQYTNQAKGEVADATKKILQDFGFMG